MEQIFTVEQARDLMPAVLARAGELVAARADLAELQADRRRGRPSALGGLPEAKGLEARLGELLGWFPEQGIEVKGFAPLLLDFPATFGDEPVLLCWLEGDTELGWYHRLDCGFPGRRPIPGTV
ncbi:MAG: DUF2203 domain-containing protein [Actinobacteria bacterium]|nr:DUF2203 domain-containing protein [Actinomycetota bacterium]